MAMTLRLPEELADRGQRFALELGISMNALVAIALREYLDARKPELRMAKPDVQALGRAIAAQVRRGPRRS